MIRQGKKAFFVTCNLFSATCLALLLAPSPALADNECGLQLDPGNPETVTCDPADYASGYPDGITYSSNGDLSVVVPNGPGLLNVFDDGISVTGNGADSIFLDASAFTSTSFNNAEIRGTGGAMVDYLSDSGDIGIDVSGGRTSINVSMRAGAGNTHGIHAVSGSGNIDILVRGILANNNSANFTAIEAVTGGGDIGIVSPGGISSPSGNPNSLRNGIVAETSGDGAITIDVQSARAGDRGVGGGATALRAVTDTGDISFTGGIDVGSGEESIGIHREQRIRNHQRNR
jgi:hypothetical protein